MRKTKIICTLGPSTDDEHTLRKMITAGMNVARLNFSHGSHEEHKKRIDMVKKVRAEMGVPVAILLDTKGPEIRIGCFKDESVILETGQLFTLTTRDVEGDNEMVSISYKKLTSHLEKGDKILIDDGLIDMVVTEVTDTDIICSVLNGGRLSNKKSLNLPGVNIDMVYLTEKDKQDILFGIENDVDFIAASFVRSAQDVKDVKNLLKANGGENIKVIAKIENAEGVENIDEIIEMSIGIMIARGDMGVEISFEKLPKIQKDLIKKCYAAGRIAITATQMLESMIKNPRPTRAEVSDIANAIYDGTSAIMLSGETAAGAHPVASVKTMAKIARSTEKTIHYDKRFLKGNVGNKTVTDAISHAACTMAIDLSAKAIVTVTQSGHTARMLSKFRPSCPIISTTANRKAYYQMSLSWGVNPIMNEVKSSTDELFASSVDKAKQTEMIKSGDTLIITCGSPVGISGTTNVLKVQVCE